VYPLIGAQRHAQCKNLTPPASPQISQAQCKVIAPLSSANPTLRSPHDTNLQSMFPPAAQHGGRSQRVHIFEPQNTTPFSLAPQLQGWPSFWPRQLTHLLHSARRRADNADQLPVAVGGRATYQPCLRIWSWCERGLALFTMAPRRRALRSVSSHRRTCKVYLQACPRDVPLFLACLLLLLLLLLLMYAGRFGGGQRYPTTLRGQPALTVCTSGQAVGTRSECDVRQNGASGPAKSRCRPAPSHPAVVTYSPHLGQRDTCRLCHASPEKHLPIRSPYRQIVVQPYTLLYSPGCLGMPLGGRVSLVGGASVPPAHLINHVFE
jgi:hypothetical protein